MNISGNYNSTNKEVDIVKTLLDLNNVSYQTVEKYPIADDGDVLITFNSGRNILIEVKEEKYTRFSKYGDLGIDFISAFQFKNPNDVSLWKGSPKKPYLLTHFLNSINKETSFKPGKIEYSKSDLWLFFVENNGNIEYYSFLPGYYMTSDEFKNYLYINCDFAVNNKPANQLSYHDSHNSAVFFINHTNQNIVNHIVNVSDFINHKDEDNA